MSSYILPKLANQRTVLPGSYITFTSHPTPFICWKYYRGYTKDGSRNTTAYRAGHTKGVTTVKTI